MGIVVVGRARVGGVLGIVIGGGARVGGLWE